MGRKIPGRKHRGVKDPEKQRAVRFQSLKGKINAAPTNPDYQEIPKSVDRIAQLKAGIKNKRKKSKKVNQFEQHKGESDKHFLYRVQRTCDAVIREKAFENKYGVDIKRNPQTGEVEKLVKKPKDIIDEFMKSARKKNKKGDNSSKNDKKGKSSKKNKKVTTVNSEPVLTKSQKRQKKLNEKKQQRKLNLNMSEVEHEAVRFGEVAHEPPTLTLSKKFQKEGVPRPGARDLLLKSVMKGDATDENKVHKKTREQSANKTINKVIDKSGKRKNLPVALRRRLEKQQAEVIDAYRALKKQNNASV